MRIYLAGAIWGVVDPITWRRKLTSQLPEGWEVIDPTQIELFVDNEVDYESAQKLVSGDLRAIESCDVMLALLNTPSWGTAMEIFYANQLGIPVIGWNPEGKPVGPWLVVHCEDILSNFEDIKLFLQNLLANA